MTQVYNFVKYNLHCKTLIKLLTMLYIHDIVFIGSYMEPENICYTDGKRHNLLCLQAAKGERIGNKQMLQRKLP